MGIDYDVADVLIRLRSEGVPFDRVLMLGRQTYIGSTKGTRRLFEKHRLPCTWVPPNPYPQNYSEGLFTALGAKTVDSMDVTTTEKPTLIHDLNQPVPANLHNQFDIVLDGGTLEHVFNVPQAFANCMKMVRVGGKFIADTVANNYMGHGFYQFSPELFFDLLSPKNGFKVDRLTIVEHSPRHRKFDAISPAEARQRVETITFWRTSLICVATKQADVPMTTPQQADYAESFTYAAGHRPGEFHKTTALERFIVEHFPRLTVSLKAVKFSALKRSLSLRNRVGYRKLAR